VAPKKRSSKQAARAAPADPAPEALDPRSIALLTVQTLTAQLRTAKGTKIVPISKALTEANKVLAKASGTYEITEASILRSQAWQRVWSVLRDALARHPEALRDVVGNLERYRDAAPESVPQ
jgi:hypothetical protein